MFGATKASSVAFLLAVCLLLGAQQASALILNPDFETGDTSNWNIVGDVSVTDSSFGVDPRYGDYQLLLTTVDDGAADVSETESTMGLSAGTIQGIFNDYILVPGESTGSGPIEGSAFQQTFYSTDPGDTVTFYYNLLTNEAVQESVTTDFIWWELERPMGSNQSGVIAHVNQDIFSSSPGTDYGYETGYQSYTIQLNAPGTYKLTIGLHDVDEFYNDTAAVIDGFFLSKAPEPNTFFLFAAGLLGLGFHARWAKGSGRKS